MKCCELCGAKMVEYKFTFNKGLARSLWRMRHFETPVDIISLGMPTSEWTNFQKLKYWDLIKPFNEKENRRSGKWSITKKGIDFLEGKTTIFHRVIMYRNKFVRFEGNLILYSNVSNGYLYRQDYKDQITGRA